MNIHLTRAAALLGQETALVRFHDLIEAEAVKHHFGRDRLSVRNMLALVLVAERPGKARSEHVVDRRLRGLSYHLGLLQERGYLLIQRTTGHAGYALYLSAKGITVCRALEATLAELEGRSARKRTV